MVGSVFAFLKGTDCSCFAASSFLNTHSGPTLQILDTGVSLTSSVGYIADRQVSICVIVVNLISAEVVHGNHWRLPIVVQPFYFKWVILVLFLNDIYRALEFPDCGNHVGADRMKTWRGIIWNCPCILLRPIQIRPYILGRPIRICPCILGRPIPNFCFKFYSQLYSQFHF